MNDLTSIRDLSFAIFRITKAIDWIIIPSGSEIKVDVEEDPVDLGTDVELFLHSGLKPAFVSPLKSQIFTSLEVLSAGTQNALVCIKMSNRIVTAAYGENYIPSSGVS